jgi:hypothetical protein
MHGAISATNLPLSRKENPLPTDLSGQVAEGVCDSTNLAYVCLPNDYHHSRSLVAQARRRVRWGGSVAGWDCPRSRPAVRDYLPAGETLRNGPFWSWRKIIPHRGVYRREPQAVADYLIFIPFVNGENLLARALASIPAYGPKTVIVDQSRAGLGDHWSEGACVFRWEDLRHFVNVQNFMQRTAEWYGLPYFFFMHHDAWCANDAIGVLLKEARMRQDNWAVLFTAYDALCCYRTQAMVDVGCWDDAIECYVADCDYYLRCRLAGYTTVTVSGAQVVHTGSQTLKRMAPAERQRLQRSHLAARQYFKRKWGAPCPAHRYAFPFGGTGI